MQPDDAGSFLHVPAMWWLGGRSVGRIDEHGNTNGLGHQLVQESQPLGHDLQEEKIDAGRVAARPGEAGDKTKLDRVFADTEDDRDRRGRGFGRDRSGAHGRGDHGHTTADQVSHQRRQAIVLALQPVVLDRHVLALDIAGFAKSFAERESHSPLQASADPSVDKSDHRKRQLLRTAPRPATPLRRRAPR